MNKNKKIILVTVGVMLVLILSVLLIRSPAADKPASAPTPPKQVEQTTATPAPAQKDYDDSHQKVDEMIDDATAALVERAPGMWGKIEHFWDWLTGFKTYHAIILILVLFFLVGVVFNDKNKNHQRH